MTVDLSKVKAGDKVQLEFTVVKSRHDDRLCFQVSNHPMADQFVLFGSRVRNFEIVGHTPAPPPPWVPKAGDRIRVINTPATVSTILYVDKDGDWLIKHDSGGKIFSPKIYHKYYELI